MPARPLLLALLSLAAAVAVPAHAATVSFAGTFTRDDDRAALGFSVPVAGAVTVQSFSYAGGVNGAAVAVPHGGFDPSIAIFDAGGTLVASQDDATPACSGVANDPVTNECFDVYLVTTLAAGNYTLVLTQFDNTAVGPLLSDGFARTGNGSFTAVFGCTNGQFCDVDADNRTGAWAVDLTTVPLPTAGWLLVSAIGAVAARRRTA